jgi:hypothetical protein
MTEMRHYISEAVQAKTSGRSLRGSDPPTSARFLRFANGICVERGPTWPIGPLEAARASAPSPRRLHTQLVVASRKNRAPSTPAGLARGAIRGSVFPIGNW